MHPAPSVILFSRSSRARALGYLAFLGLGFSAVSGWAAFALWGLAMRWRWAGLLASTFHLGNPQRALLAFYAVAVKLA